MNINWATKTRKSTEIKNFCNKIIHNRNRLTMRTNKKKFQEKFFIFFNLEKFTTKVKKINYFSILCDEKY